MVDDTKEPESSDTEYEEVDVADAPIGDVAHLTVSAGLTWYATASEYANALDARKREGDDYKVRLLRKLAEYVKETAQAIESDLHHDGLCTQALGKVLKADIANVTLIVKPAEDNDELQTALQFIREAIATGEQSLREQSLEETPLKTPAGTFRVRGTPDLN